MNYARPRGTVAALVTAAITLAALTVTIAPANAATDGATADEIASVVATLQAHPVIAVRRMIPAEDLHEVAQWWVEQPSLVDADTIGDFSDAYLAKMPRQEDLIDADVEHYLDCYTGTPTAEMRATALQNFAQTAGYALSDHTWASDYGLGFASGVVLPSGQTCFAGVVLYVDYTPAGYWTASPSPSIDVTPPTSYDSTKLSANTGSWNPITSTFTYQWYSDGAAISGAKYKSYFVPKNDSTPHTYTVRVRPVRSDYPFVSRYSAPLLIEGTFAYTRLPTIDVIDGGAFVGATLTHTPPSITPTPDAYTYQWLRNGAAIAGETGPTHQLISADIGKNLSLRVTATKDQYTTLTLVSPSNGQYIFPTFVNAPKPTIAGTRAPGKILTARNGTWTPTMEKYTYRWYRNGVAIKGATTAKYQVLASDRTKRISVRVTGHKLGYAKTVSSASTLVPGVFTAVAKPTISGTLAKGKTITAAPGKWSPTPGNFTYQWMRNGLPLGGKTAKTYTLVANDRGQNVSVRVTAHKSNYTSKSQTSRAVYVTP